MASATDFLLSGDHDASKTLVTSTLGSLGFELATLPTGIISVSRGNEWLSLLVGGLAGKSFYVRFLLSFAPDADNLLLAKLEKSAAGSAVRGGALGFKRSNDAFAEAVGAIGDAAVRSGLLVASREV